jgi:hypothetical protein
LKTTNHLIVVVGSIIFVGEVFATGFVVVGGVTDGANSRMGMGVVVGDVSARQLLVEALVAHAHGTLAHRRQQQTLARTCRAYDVPARSAVVLKPNITAIFSLKNCSKN